jgi:uncharacterized membrane protein (UPF0127 family)
MYLTLVGYFLFLHKSLQARFYEQIFALKALSPVRVWEEPPEMYLTLCRVFFVQSSKVLGLWRSLLCYPSYMKKLLLLVVLLVAASVGAYFYIDAQPDPSTKTMPKVTAEIGNGTFTLYAPVGDEGLQRGLAAFNQIGPNEGMIFRGLPVGVQTFWMKDMKFDIDILWVNKENVVIHTVYDASKDSYPTKYENPQERPSAYVIELTAGAAEKNNIAPGSVVKITE